MQRSLSQFCYDPNGNYRFGDFIVVLLIDTISNRVRSDCYDVANGTPEKRKWLFVLVLVAIYIWAFAGIPLATIKENVGQILGQFSTD